MNIDKQQPDPKDEKARLQALKDYQVLDTLPEENYNAIAELASYICKTPIALISLIDDKRQWFKARKGLDMEDTARDASFCQYAMLNDGVYVVPNAPEHPVHAYSPMVTGEPGIVFYAGAPLISPEGHRLGTLCVLDTKPHSLNPEQEKALQTLAGSVIDLLELNKQRQTLKANLKKLQESETRFKNIYENSGMGVALVNTDGRPQAVNPALERILGYHAEELKSMNFAQFTHPEDIEKDLQLFNSMLQGRIDHYTIEKRYIKKNKKVIWANLTASLLLDDRGNIDCIIGLIEDITEKKMAETRLKEREQNYRELVENSHALLCVHDMQGDITRTNTAIQKRLGYTRKELAVMNLKQLLVPRHAQLLEQYLKKIQGKQWQEGKFDIVAKNGKRLY